jgi:excisionase family DNA binding protein
VKQLEELMETDEIARIFKVNPRTIERWVAAGILPAVRVGGIRRFRRSDIDRLTRP